MARPYLALSNKYVLSTIAILDLGVLLNFLTKLYEVRSRFARLSSQGMVRHIHDH